MMHHAFALFTLFLVAPVCADPSLPRLPYFKSLCVREKETGFNWKNGDWVQANFSPGKQILVQKIDVDAAKDKAPLTENMFQPCRPEESRDLKVVIHTTACYVVKEIGTPTTILNVQMCTERFNYKHALQDVRCEQVTFQPDGGFIERPLYVDVDLHPPKDYKDSLALAVGRCTRIVD
jgi:hypothetical protein